MESKDGLLLTLQASSFKLKKHKKDSYNLSLLSPSEGLLFGDRPARNAETISIESIAKNWKQAFRDDPPNAVLSSPDESEPISGVFEIKKLKLKDKKIKLKITFSEEQKASSGQLLSPDLITGKNTSRRASLFIDSIFDWLDSARKSSLVIKNNAGTGSAAGMGMMSINWDNTGTMSALAASKQVLKVANGQGTGDACNPSMAGSNANSFDVGAQVLFGNTENNEWLVENPNSGKSWISHNKSANKIYNHQTPRDGSTTVGNLKYKWTIDFVNDACEYGDTSYDQWRVTYHDEVPSTSNI